LMFASKAGLSRSISPSANRAYPVTMIISVSPCLPA
jgi:hypothetical protein